MRTIAAVLLAALTVGCGVSDDDSDAASSRPSASPSVSVAASVPDDARMAVVTGHVDGDTLRLTSDRAEPVLASGVETRVRLLEVDAPESVAPGSPEECYAARAGQALEELVPVGTTVWVQPDRELLDRFGRTLLYVWTTDGVFVNLHLVREGYARAVLYEPNDAYIDRMRRAEAAAKAEGIGLWGACDYFGEPSGPATAPSPDEEPREGLDPRFPNCADALAAGYGEYVRGVDPEYAWYNDGDGDGIACEPW